MTVAIGYGTLPEAMTVVIGGGYAEVGVGCDCVDDGCSQWTAEGEIVLDDTVERHFASQAPNPA